MITASHYLMKKDILSTLSDIVVCEICHNILLDPIQCCSCEQCYCRSCIEEAKPLQKACIHCDSMSFKKSILMKKILSKSNFKCSQCGKLIKYLDLADHYKLNCEKLDVAQKEKEIKSKIADYHKRCKEIQKENMKLIEDLDVNNMNIKEDYEDVIITKYHPHPLLKAHDYDNEDDNNSDNSNNMFFCDVCKDDIKKPRVSYYCDKCSFDYCDRCYLSEIKQRDTDIKHLCP